MKEVKFFENRRQARRYTWLKNWLEDRLYASIMDGDIKTGSDRWRKYNDLIEECEERAHRYYERYIQNT